MATILQLGRATLIPLLWIVAAVVGFNLPARLFGSRPGFLLAVGICSVPTLLCSVLGAFLAGGWGEDQFGPAWGVPIGVAIGSLLASIVANVVAGSVGILFHAALGRV